MPLDDVAPEISQFVDEYIDQFVTWDVLAYFHENQEVEVRPEDIATDIGRRISAVRPVLEALLDKRVLNIENDEAEGASYHYAASADFRNKMDDFLTATRNRTNRLAIVSRVLQKEAKRL